MHICPRVLQTRDSAGFRRDTYGEQYIHLQTDISTDPLEEDAEPGKGLWSGRDDRVRQIRIFVRDLQRLSLMEQDTLLHPVARIRQVREATRRGELRLGMPASARWRKYCYKLGAYFLRSELFLTRPLGAAPGHRHTVRGSDNTAAFVKDADAVWDLIVPGAETLAECVNFMGNHASASYSSLDVIRELRRRLELGTLSRAQPPQDWLPMAEKVISGSRGARLSHVWNLELSNTSNKPMWE